MIALPAAAIPKSAFYEFLREHGFTVEERPPNQLFVSNGPQFTRVWLTQTNQPLITNYFLEKICNACGIEQDDIDTFLASIPDPNLREN